jgi:parallel beta-helix repeat protein
LHECVGWYNWKWGYSFHNPRTDDLSFRRYAQTFGKDEVYYTIKICIHPPLCIPFVGCYCAKYILKISTPIPKLFPGIYYLAAYKDLAEGGECYGMSATSLRFYYGHDYPFNYNYSATRVKDLTVNDEYGSHSLRVRREIHHGSQMSAENINYYLWNLGEGNEANYVLNKARGGLKNKNQNMVSIKNGLLNGHVMNYDSVEDFDDGTSKIYVYDNNKEKFVNDLNAYTDKYPAIIVDRNKNSWSYKKNGEVWGSDMIFDIPYSIANRKDWSLPTSLSGISKIIFGDATGNIEDMDGNLLGYDEFNNAYEDIPVGLGVPVFAGDEQPAILAVQPGNYNFNIFGSDGEYSDLIAGLNGAYVLENISSNNNTRDSLEFRMINGNPYYNELSFQTNDVQKPFNVTMFKVFGEDFDCRMYRIFNMNITNESKIYMKVSSDYNSLVFSNRGSDTLTYDVEFQNEMVDIDHYVPDQIPRLLITNLQIDPGQTQTITPENWGSLKNSEVTINTETCGDLICSIGEDHVNCPHDCEEIACVEPHDDMHITESTLLCSGTYPIDDWGDGGVIVIDNDDVVLDCNGAKLDGNGYGIAIISDSTKNVTVKNCYIQNFSTAVMFNNVTNAKIFHSAFISNADSGIELIGSNQSNITQNYIKDNGCGIQIYSSTDTEISQNLVCPNVNIDIYSHTNNVNDTGFDNACGNAQGWDDINTTGCTYKCTYPVCVTPTDDLYINSDTILCPGFYNIPDSGAEGVIIINASDIVLDCNGATLNGTMTGSDYGIYSRGFDNVTIKNCNVMNYLAGIELEMSSNSTITNNNLSLNRYGIYLFYSDYSIITSNTANSNRYKGIGLASSSNNLVANNIVNTNGDGIFLGSFSSNNRIESNTASSNRQAGIYIYGNSSSNDFSNNKINNNLYGIYLGPCICPTCSHYCPGGNFNNTIKANEILDNEIGIFSNQSNSMIDSNMVCNNIELDFNSSDWLTSSGDNNTCNKPDGWNDFEITGCTYSCPSSKGDLNDDGKITTADAVIALQFAASGEWCAEADVDCDGRVTSLDALMILQAAAGNIELQGCEP